MAVPQTSCLTQNGGSEMVVHTAIGLTEAREYYKRVQAGEKNVHFPPPLVLSGGEINLMASPAVERLAKNLAKIYIETQGMK